MARSTSEAGRGAPEMSFIESFMGRASAPPSAHAKGQVKLGELCQQWYARPAGVPFADNPCNFNAIGAVTGTRRAIESRPKEQACKWRSWSHWMKQGDPQNHAQANTAPRKIIQGAKGVSRKIFRDANTALCRRWRVC